MTEKGMKSHPMKKQHTLLKPAHDYILITRYTDVRLILNKYLIFSLVKPLEILTNLSPSPSHTHLGWDVAPKIFKAYTMYVSPLVS